MANMSYCRFQNTLQDLRNCQAVMFEEDDLSLEEERARRQLIELCHDIVQDTEDAYEEILRRRTNRQLNKEVLRSENENPGTL